MFMFTTVYLMSNTGLNKLFNSFSEHLYMTYTIVAVLHMRQLKVG